MNYSIKREKRIDDKSKEIWNVIHNLYNSTHKTTHIKIETAFKHGNDSKIYGVHYSGRDGFRLNFIVSENNGLWGIDRIKKVEEILSIIVEEIRQSKIENILL